MDTFMANYFFHNALGKFHVTLLLRVEEQEEPLERTMKMSLMVMMSRGGVGGGR